MPVPTSYDEPLLAGLMVTWLGDIGRSLGWTEETSRVLEAISETEVALEVTDVADVPSEDFAKLRAIARVSIWRAAEGSLAARYRMTSGDQSLDRGQAYEHAKEQRIAAETDAMAFGLTGYEVTTVPVTYIHDPYLAIDQENRTL